MEAESTAQPDQQVAAAAGAQSVAVSSPWPSPSKDAHGLVLTLGRIKTFIKEDPDVKSISTEACFMVARATELLLEAMAQRSGQTMLEGQREELDYKDVATTVSTWDALDFLRDMVPQKVPAALILDRMAAQGQ